MSIADVKLILLHMSIDDHICYTNVTGSRIWHRMEFIFCSSVFVKNSFLNISDLNILSSHKISWTLRIWARFHPCKMEPMSLCRRNKGWGEATKNQGEFGG